MPRTDNIHLVKPPLGCGVQLTHTMPFGQLPFNVWYEGYIVRFCSNAAQAFGWLWLIQAEGLGIIDKMQEIAGNIDEYVEGAMPWEDLERYDSMGSVFEGREDDEGSDNNSDVQDE